MSNASLDLEEYDSLPASQIRSLREKILMSVSGQTFAVTNEREPGCGLTWEVTRFVECETSGVSTTNSHKETCLPRRAEATVVLMA